MDVKRPEPNFEDERGSITDILYREEIDSVTVISSRKGAVRGNHYHKDTIQHLYVLEGEVRILSKLPGGETQAVALNAGEFVTHPPMEAHAVEALEDSRFLILTRGPRGGLSYEDDTYRLNSPLTLPDAS